MGVPLNPHPCLDGSFPLQKPSSYGGGTPMAMETTYITIIKQYEALTIIILLTIINHILTILDSPWSIKTADPMGFRGHRGLPGSLRGLGGGASLRRRDDEWNPGGATGHGLCWVFLGIINRY